MCGFASAQVTVNDGAAQGYLERGRLMYESQNYVGAIDQLSEMLTLPHTDRMREDAEYYIALSKFERGDRELGLEALSQWITNNPTSPRQPEAMLKVGDYYFYRGDYADCYDDALRAYEEVRPNALSADAAEDLKYRMAYCQLRLGRYNRARQIYSGLANTKRYADATKFYDAYIDYANGNYDAAKQSFEKLQNRSSELGYQSQYYICQIEFVKKNYDKVISLGKGLIRDNANDYFTAEMNRLVGESYYQQGDDALADTYLRKYLAVNEGAPMRTATYALGVIDFRKNDFASAIERMNSIIGVDDALSQSAYLYLGQSRMKLGDMNSAAIAFEKAANMDHDAGIKEVAFYNYAVSQSQGGRTPFDRSIDMLETFLNNYPRSEYAPRVEDYLVDAYMTTTDHDKALASIERIKNPSKRVLQAKQDVLYNLGVKAIKNDNTDAAKNYLKQAVALGALNKKTLAESQLWLGEAQYRAGEYKEAMNSQLAFINSTSTSDPNYGLAQYNLGYTLLKQKRYESARLAFQNALASGTLSTDLHADAYNRIGDTNYYTQNYKDAEASYEKAISEDKEGTADYAMYQKAMMAGMNKQTDSKLQQIDKMIAAYPQSELVPQALLEKGNTLAAAGNPRDAVTTYTDLVKRYPQTAEARKAMLQQAIVEKSRGNDAEAIVAFKRVISTYPASEEAQAAAEDAKLICADRGELNSFMAFLNGVPGGPRLDVSEVDKLTFEAAEKAAIASKPSISKMEAYLKNYPDGAYVAKAKYYVGRYNYSKGNYDVAMTNLDAALKNNTDASFAEDAIAIKCAILGKQGKKAEALEAYKNLVEKSTTADNLITARLGVLRLAGELGKWEDVKTCADQLLKAGGLTAEEEKEVTLERAVASGKLGNSAAAEKDLHQLARDVQNEFGAQAAYELAQLQFDRGETKAAEKTLNDFIENGTPHAYWLARGFILLADVYNKQGNTSEACDYLESLKSNYPGKEKEIFDAISSRLNNWRQAAKKTTKK